ncbi:hypothetical protein M407DRAFT_246724 [Tulasnella calospora MUT 4182]|uniref:Uncharacterized protein n=1 Tax=Tulasnella calospora MUT 4182 TaxID=1051891 RepID=A0A0C3K7X2_9AGAM|nr:hypothetical protein M407DRAFT_246724 [Tulasnella calospora MUT 4182]
MISGASGRTYEIRSTHLTRGEERRTRDLEGVPEETEGMDEAMRREQPQFNFRVTSPPLPPSSPASPRHSLDWISNPNANTRRPRLDDSTLPRRSDVVVGPSTDPSSPPHSNRPSWFGRQLGGPDQAPSGGNRHSGSFGTSRYFATLRSWDEQPSVVEMDDLAGVSQNVETTRRSTGCADPLEQPPELPPSRPPDASQSSAHHRHPHPRREGSGD